MIIISMNQRLNCQSCGRANAFPTHIDSESIPVEIVCPGCAYSWKITDKQDRRYTRLAKVDPRTKPDGTWSIIPVQESASDDDGKSPGEILLEELRKPDEVKDASIYQAIKEANATGITFMYQMSQVQEMIQRVIDSFGENMREHLDIARGMSSWNQNLLYHFFAHPFSKIDANCLDEEIEPMSGFLLCPKFYPKLHGYPISCRGGYYVQAITPYSQLAFPVESHLMNSLKIAGPLDLRVLGDKIIGRDLVQYYNKIPGVRLDIDHTAMNPSVVMDDHFAARCWLAKHGVFAWPNMTGLSEMFFPFHEKMITADCDIDAVVSFYKEFIQKGRAILCWQDHRLARMAAAVVGHGMRGVKMVFSDADETYDWHKGFRMAYADKHSFVYCKPRERASIPDMDQVSMIIIDAVYTMPEPSFLIWLQQFRKAIVIILKDGILDTFEENDYAPAFYSLANMVSIIPDDAHWRNAWKSHEQDPPDSVRRALQSMRLLERGFPAP